MTVEEARQVLVDLDESKMQLALQTLDAEIHCLLEEATQDPRSEVSQALVKKACVLEKEAGQLMRLQCDLRLERMGKQADASLDALEAFLHKHRS